jgi:pimeloyl-ACP methyl ester carboxylesterase
VSHPIFFAHANGFPASTYVEFLEGLKPQEVLLIDRLGHLRGVGPQWSGIVEEIEAALQQQVDSNGQRVIYVGHSLGAFCGYLLACQRPELFERIIMMEAPMVANWKRNLVAMFRVFGLNRFFPPASLARKRRSLFDNRQEAFDYFRNKALFDSFSDRALADYVEFGLMQDERGVFRLRIPPSLETDVFCELPRKIPRLNPDLPSHYLYGELSDVMKEADLNELQKRLSSTEFIEMEGGHLFPQEYPKQAAAKVLELIKG